MKPYLLLLLATFPLAAQLPNRMIPRRTMPPDIISNDEIIRDVMAVGFKHVTVDLDNDRTRVLRFQLTAGEAVPTHDDRAGVLVCLTACKIRLTMQDGSVEDLDLKAGQTRWLAPARRITRNLGGAVELLYVESKRPQS